MCTRDSSETHRHHDEKPNNTGDDNDDDVFKCKFLKSDLTSQYLLMWLISYVNKK